MGRKYIATSSNLLDMPKTPEDIIVKSGILFAFGGLCVFIARKVRKLIKRE